MSTTRLATPEVDIATIRVEEGRNARRHFDEAALRRLAESIKKTGVVEPIVICPAEDGYVLTAGERRLRAAKLAGLKQVPVTVREESSRTASFVENVQRERLDPVEEAEGLEALAADLGLGSAKALAAEVGMSAAWVGVRRRLLKLPEKAREHIAAGTVPIDAEPELRKIAAASPRIAECVCEVFAAGDSETGDFLRDIDELLYAVADRVTEGTLDDPPTMIDPRGIRLGEVFDDAGVRDELAVRLGTARRVTAGPALTVSLGDVELTIARAAGVLLEYETHSGHFSHTITFLTDRVLAADLVRCVVEREGKQAKKREKAREREAEKVDPQEETDERDERAKANAAAAKARLEERRAARAYNDRLGHALMKRRGAQTRKKYGLARAKAGAIARVLRDRGLASAGLRLVMPQLQGLQTDTAGTGEGAVAYASLEQANQFLIGRIEASRSVAEIDELMADAEIAAILADQDAVDAVDRSHRHDPAEEKVRELLTAEIKEVAPRRSPKQRKLEQDS